MSCKKDIQSATVIDIIYIHYRKLIQSITVNYTDFMKIICVVMYKCVETYALWSLNICSYIQPHTDRLILCYAQRCLMYQVTLLWCSVCR